MLSLLLLHASVVAKMVGKTSATKWGTSPQHAFVATTQLQFPIPLLFVTVVLATETNNDASYIPWKQGW